MEIDKIWAGGDDLFERLRDEDYIVRLKAFDSFIAESAEEEPGAVLSDFVEIIDMEIIPELSASKTPTHLEALAYIYRRLGEFALALPNPSSLTGLIDRMIGSIGHSSARVSAMALAGLGMIFQAMPDELFGERSDALRSALAFEDEAALDAAVSAWSRIASVAPKKALFVTGEVFALLRHSDARVRNQALGYFYTLGKKMKSECSFALPALRELRDGDSDMSIRERASAAIQAISQD